MADKLKPLKNKHYDGFADWAALRAAHCDRRDWEDDYKEKLTEITPVKEPTLVFAFYEYACYEGRSLVVFMHKKKWWVNEASHCSCNGLEGGWHPSAHSKKEIERMYVTNNWRLDKDNMFSYPEAHEFVRWWKKVNRKKRAPKKVVIAGE